MYLSQLILNPRSREVRRDLANCQQLHRTLLSAFPQAETEAARQEFGLLFRVEIHPRTGVATVLAQSVRQPDWTNLPPEYLNDEAACQSLADKYTADVLHAQRRLRFRLRANPTRKIETKSLPDGTKRNGRRVELFRAEDQIAWLQRKGQTTGFRVLDLQRNPDVPNTRVWNVRTNPENKLTGWRKGSDKPMKFGSVLFEGELEITNAEQFRQALIDGIGTGKAYGFGLLSIAPVSG